MTQAEDIAEVEANPVRSMHHEWTAGEQQEYNVLNAKGRTLYDNLRTQKGYSHKKARRAAHTKYGEFDGE